MDGWMDEWMDGWMYSRMYVCFNPKYLVKSEKFKQKMEKTRKLWNLLPRTFLSLFSKAYFWRGDILLGSLEIFLIYFHFLRHF